MIVRTWFDLIILSQLRPYIDGNISFIKRYIDLRRSIAVMQTPPVTERDNDVAVTTRTKLCNTTVTMNAGVTLTG